MRPHRGLHRARAPPGAACAWRPQHTLSLSHVAPAGGPRQCAPPPRAAADTAPLSPSPPLTPPTTTVCLTSLPLPDLEAFIATLPDARSPASRARQLFRWLHREKVACLTDAAADRVPRDGFSPAFLASLDAAGATDDPGAHLIDVRTAGDGTRRLIFEVARGAAAGATVDAVLIPDTGALPSRRGGPSPRPRLTLCVSSQVGCGQGCAFCLTGAAGRGRNLTAGQIVAQVTAAARLVEADPTSPPLTGVVFMGQGEPLDNAGAVLAATRVITHPLGHSAGPPPRHGVDRGR